MLKRCPRCHHQPLPSDQALPAACPACGVILAKAAQRLSAGEVRALVARRVPPWETAGSEVAGEADAPLWSPVPKAVSPEGFWGRVGLWIWFGVWGLRLIALDHRTGEMNASFLHGPLLIFHEAGHVVFRLLGEWMMVLGGTLGQLIMPAVLAIALLWKNRDPFGAALGLWLFGVSVLDVAPYMYDALEPQLMLLSGTTGEEGGHDWIRLFSSMGLLQRSQGIGTFTHRVGALLVLLALGWAAWVLVRQWRWLASRGRPSND